MAISRHRVFRSGRARRGCAVAAAPAPACATVALYAPADAAFTGVPRNPGNTWTAAAASCASPGSWSATASQDAHVREGFPTLNGGTGTKIFVSTGTGAADRGLVQFTP